MADRGSAHIACALEIEQCKLSKSAEGYMSIIYRNRVNENGRGKKSRTSQMSKPRERLDVARAFEYRA